MRGATTARPRLALLLTLLLGFSAAAPAHAADITEPDLWSSTGAINQRSIPGLTLPEDFWSEWGLYSDGQTVGDTATTPGNDIDVVRVWQAGDLGQGVAVADVDTGIVAGVNVSVASGGATFAAGTSSTQDAVGHGTGTASIIAAQGGRDASVIGVAPRASIIPIRVIGAPGTDGSPSAVDEGLEAAGRVARIVNVSLGGASPDPHEAQAFLDHPNSLYVVAAGNSGANDDSPASPYYPCDYSSLANVICAGAVQPNFAAASFSDFGASSVDLFAPGRQVLCDWQQNGAPVLVTMDGTSAATPMVSGVAALMLAANPKLTAPELKLLLMHTVRRVPALSGLAASGGVVDADAAVEAARAAAGQASEASAPRTAQQITGLRFTGEGHQRRVVFSATQPGVVTLYISEHVCRVVRGPRGARQTCSWRVVSRPVDREVVAGRNTVLLHGLSDSIPADRLRVRALPVISRAPDSPRTLRRSSSSSSGVSSS